MFAVDTGVSGTFDGDGGGVEVVMQLMGGVGGGCGGADGGGNGGQGGNGAS